MIRTKVVSSLFCQVVEVENFSIRFNIVDNDSVKRTIFSQVLHYTTMLKLLLLLKMWPLDEMYFYNFTYISKMHFQSFPNWKGVEKWPFQSLESCG